MWMSRAPDRPTEIPLHRQTRTRSLRRVRILQQNERMSSLRGREEVDEDVKGIVRASSLSCSTA